LSHGAGRAQLAAAAPGPAAALPARGIVLGMCRAPKNTWKVTNCATSGEPQSRAYLIESNVAAKSVPGAYIASDTGPRQRSSIGDRLSRNV